ncbi:MAG: hypothetical protein AAFY73_12325, partial [Pseudomonadota bacterium]
RAMAQRAFFILAAIALTFAGSVHQSAIASPHGTAQSIPAEVAENPDLYRLPDGTLPFICITVDGEGSSLTGHCEFCRIADHVLLPEFDAPLLPRIVADTDLQLAIGGPVDHQPGTRRARAPPIHI